MPCSLTPSKLINLGREINKGGTSNHVPIKISTFDYGSQKWSQERIRGLEIKNVIGQGGFRIAKSGLLDGEEIVVKFYHEQSKDTMNLIDVSQDSQARKSVQMQACAMYLTQKFNKKLEGSANHFTYVKASLGVLLGGPDKNAVVTLEKKLSGDFVKYVNNNGAINPDDNFLEYQPLAEVLTHFSYEHSDGKLILVDLQGVGLQLTDPETATLGDEDKEEEEEMLFCIGNNGKGTFHTFFFAHVCNAICKDIGLKYVDHTLFQK